MIGKYRSRQLLIARTSSPGKLTSRGNRQMKLGIYSRVTQVACCIVLFANTALAAVQDYDFFYEFKTQSEPAMSNCLSGDMYDIQEQIKNEFNENNDGVSLDFVCISKSQLLSSSDPEVTLLIPYLESGEMAAEKLGRELKGIYIYYDLNCFRKRDNCLEWQDRTTGAFFPFQKFAYEYSSAAELTYFPNETYDVPSIQAAVARAGEQNKFLSSLFQVRLKAKGYYIGRIDGDFGINSQRALGNYIRDNLSINSDGQFVTTHLISVLFPNLLKYQSDADYRSPTKSEPSQSVETETTETSSVSAAENSEELNASEVNSETVSEAPEETEQAEPGQASADEANENEQLALEVLDLRKQLEEQQDSYGSLKESHEKEMASLREDHEQEISSLTALMQQPISQVWDAKVSKKSFKITGKLPNGNSVDLTVLERGFSDRYCTLTIDQPLETQFIKNLKREKCFILTLKEYDEDTNSSRAYDEDNNTLTIPVLEKQSDLITSIASESLDDFDEVDTNFCWVGLKLLNEANRDTGTTIELWMQVVDVDGRIEAKLTDFDTVANKELFWRNRKLQLVDLTPKGQTTSCMVTNTKAFDVIDRKSDPNNSAPIALIDRSGNVVLKNLPLVKKQSPELHVFLDTLAGPEGDENYGFNGAINSEEDRETQRLYFKGFLNGVQTFLSKRLDIEKVTIYQTVMQGKNRELQELQTFTRANTAGDSDLITDDFISNYISEFNAGVPGEFDNKKRKLPRLLKANGNSLFISFGSSGLTDDKVCQRKIPRQDYTENSVIFDVVPSFTVRQLSEANELETVSRGFAFKCSNQDRIIPLKPLSSIAREEVNEVIEAVLGDWRY